MNTTLIPCEPLTQVVFVHDYIQLVFQDETFNLYNQVELEYATRLFRSGELGFCDTLVSLINKRVVSTSSGATCKLELTFEGGTRLRVRPDVDSACGPDSFEYFGPQNLLVSEPNY